MPANTKMKEMSFLNNEKKKVSKKKQVLNSLVPEIIKLTNTKN